MELWIRSQKNEELRQGLFKVNEIELGDYDNDMNCLVINNLYCVGIYKTKERALEVLDEIQNILKPKYILDTSSIKPEGKFYIDNGELCQNYSGNTKIEELSTFVYQMPEK